MIYLVICMDTLRPGYTLVSYWTVWTMVRSSSLYLRDFQFSWVRLRADRVARALPGSFGHEVFDKPILWYGITRDRLPGARNEGILECGDGMDMISKRFESRSHK